MKGGNSYRILKLRELLFRETDEENQLTITELNEKLGKVMDETFDVRTLKRDMEVLADLGFDVIQNKGKYGKNLYSHQDRLFETYQLRLINDAILSARFITSNEKKYLIKKTKQLTSKYIAETLPNPILFSPSSNMNYDLIKLNIDRVHRAIYKQRVLTYQYGSYNVEKEFEFHRDGEIYEVEPYALIWQNDYYYLIGHYLKNNEIRHYRLDRIRNIQVTEQRFRKQPFNLEEYVNQTFHMFAGKDTRIKIRFVNNLVNVMLDRFGHDADIKRLDEDHFVLTTKAKLSDGLINWILTWGNQAKVLSPPEVVDAVKNKIIDMQKLYDE